MRVRRGVRWVGIAFLFVMSAAACGTSSVALSDDDDAPASSTTSSTTTSTTVTPSSTTSTTTSSTTSTTTTTTTAPATVDGDLLRDEEGVPLNGQTDGVLITPTGWIAPIVDTSADGWTVWTPCGRTADLTGGRVVEYADFVIDPGHGGNETGAVGPGGLREADLNLEVALKLRDTLVGAGYSVIMTRQTDVRVPIVTRGEIAQALDPIAFISVHFNAGTDAWSDEPGTEMFHQIESAESKRLAGLLYEEVFGYLEDFDITWVSLSDAGAMSRPNREGGDYYGVLRRPGPVTSVLAEYGYISNQAEEELYSDPAVQQQLADATLRAVRRLLTTSDPGSGFTTDPIFRGYGPSGAGRTDNCVDPKLQ